jgi:predicted nucleotide-binding protein
VRNAKGAFWTFADNKQSYAATSYAVITLTSQQNWENNFGRQINESVEFLRTGAKSFWPIEQEHSVSGDFIYNFHHFTLAWTVIAFLSAGVSIFDPLIMRAVDRLYRGHYNLNTGGWSEEENHRPSIFGTSHVLAALEMFYQSLTVGVYLQHLDERNIQMSQDNSTPNHVFIVHGHDNAVKQEVARFLERIGCNPIILEEQVDAGMTTIIQKFSAHASRAAYAIVLLTPDDIAEDGAGKKAGRARQNVVMELGFFIAKLGAEHVCLAKKGDVEIPSDIAGALYLNLDDGGWQLSLARKLKSAGLTIDLSKLV